MLLDALFQGPGAVLAGQQLAVQFHQLLAVDGVGRGGDGSGDDFLLALLRGVLHLLLVGVVEVSAGRAGAGPQQEGQHAEQQAPEREGDVKGVHGACRLISLRGYTACKCILAPHLSQTCA